MSTNRRIDYWRVVYSCNWMLQPNNVTWQTKMNEYANNVNKSKKMLHWVKESRHKKNIYIYMKFRNRHNQSVVMEIRTSGCSWDWPAKDLRELPGLCNFFLSCLKYRLIVVFISQNSWIAHFTAGKWYLN